MRCVSLCLGSEQHTAVAVLGSVLEEAPPTIFFQRSGLSSRLFGTATPLVTASVYEVPVCAALKCLFTSASSLEFISGVYCCLFRRMAPLTFMAARLLVFYE